MKIKFCCDNGANIHSTRSDTFKVTDLGWTDEEWRALSEEDKLKEVEEWMNDKLDFWYEEIE